MEYFNIITIQNISTVINLYRRAIDKMSSLNIDQWDNVYPDKETIEGDILKNTMHGYFINDELCAVQVINEIQAEEYSSISWKYPAEKPLILHRLCVAPEHQNKGIAKKMIRYAEFFADENGYSVIRFDAFAENPISLGIYKKMGYRESGTVRFRKGNFFCFEKKTRHYTN